MSGQGTAGCPVRSRQAWAALTINVRQKGQPTTEVIVEHEAHMAILCEMLAAFTHVVSRYQKQRPDPAVLYVCLMAWGTNMGLGRMGEISDLPAHLLARASENELRPETLRAANDLVSNAIAALPITRHYDLDSVVHSSSDGQKFETAIPTFNARHAPKYFGLRKGIVANTLVAGNIPVNAQIIGAHEHESHYVLDLLLNNTTTVQPVLHSTDTHGTNEVNFALLHTSSAISSPRATAGSRSRCAPGCAASSTPSSTPSCCCGRPES